MKSLSILTRFNRGLHSAFRKFPMIISFITLVVIALSYQLILTPYSLLPSHWNYTGLQGLALAFAAFWLFGALAINARYFDAIHEHQRLSVKLLVQGSAALSRASLGIASFFIMGALVGWIALALKHVFLQIPYLGIALSILFAWLPFALFLLFKLLPFAFAALLYLLVPILSLHHLPLKTAAIRVMYLWRRRPIESILCTLAGLAPLIISAWLVSSLQRHTLIYLGSEDPVFIQALRRMVLAVSAAALMSPAISLLSAWGLESLQWLEQRPQDD